MTRILKASKLLLVLTIGVALTSSSIETSSLTDYLPTGAFDTILSVGQEGFGRTSRLIGRGLDLIRPDKYINGLINKQNETNCNQKIHVISKKANDELGSIKKHDADRDRNVTEVIRSRQYEAEEYDVITRDGYILTIQRIINPLVKPEFRSKMKPIILQHGLMSSSVDFVINSVNVRPEVWPKEDNSKSDSNSDDEDNDNYDDNDEDNHNHNYNDNGDDDDNDSEYEMNEANLGDTQEHPNSLGFYMANRGYDVWLANSRGNIYGQRHVKLCHWQPKFWAFTFDEQIEFDLPDTIEFILKKTNKTKLGYVGHSQGTVMMLGLLSDRPEYADIVEPFVALAPVAYVDNCLSPVKYFSYLTPLMQNLNSIFAPPNFMIKYLGPIVCGPKFIKEEICANIIYLSCGFDEEELDLDRADAYLGHMPSGTSAKNIAHYGQLVNSGRFAHFDHGLLGNKMRYNSTKSPDYDLGKIRSKSIALFIASNDWLASPKDVAHLRSDLKVKPFAVYNITEVKPLWNHIDYVYAKHAGEIVNTRIEQVFKAFD